MFNRKCFKPENTQSIYIYIQEIVSRELVRTANRMFRVQRIAERHSLELPSATRHFERERDLHCYFEHALERAEKSGALCARMPDFSVARQQLQPESEPRSIEMTGGLMCMAECVAR
jgi:hypothetical protein